MPQSTPPQPTILHPLTALTLLSRILASSSPELATIIICSTRQAFLAHLLSTSTSTSHASNTLTPTLHTLATSSQIRLTFCPNVAALLGWLAAYKGTKAADKIDVDAVGAGAGAGEIESLGPCTLYIVDVLALHEATSAFSAQGLGRCFAAAVEAAGRVGERLVVVETIGKRERRRIGEGEDGLGLEDVGLGDEETNGGEAEQAPWEQEVPILNISMRRLGSGSGERGWAGRTVKVRTVAERWFRFEILRGLDAGSGELEGEGAHMDEG